MLAIGHSLVNQEHSFGGLSFSRANLSISPYNLSVNSHMLKSSSLTGLNLNNEIGLMAVEDLMSG
jgi:hypothetical protein